MQNGFMIFLKLSSSLDLLSVLTLFPYLNITIIIIIKMSRMHKSFSFFGLLVMVVVVLT